MERSAWLALCTLAVACLLAAPAAAGPAAYSCRPTVGDAFGPFGRGMPPLRARIGTGHVLTGVVLSALDCRPIRGARVELWQIDRKRRYTVATSGTVITDRAGRFRFEGPYPPSDGGFPPHIHLRVSAPAFKTLFTRYVPARGARRGTVRLVLEPAEL